MKTERLTIDSIPAIIWGERSDAAYIFVHGKQSSKEEAERFALNACREGFQTLSFDLPEHGERVSDFYPCVPDNAAHDLDVICEYARKNWEIVYLTTGSSSAGFMTLDEQIVFLEKWLDEKI